MKRVVVANCYPDDNRGSAALNDAACVIVKQAFPGASISIVSAARNGVGRSAFRHSLARHPNVEVLPSLLQTARIGGLAEAGAVGLGLLWQVAPQWMPRGRSMAALHAADLVLSRGGYVLADPGGLRSWFNPYIVMLPCRLAYRLDKTTWTMPTSVIPPRTVFGRLALRHVIRSFDRLAVRDPKARPAAEELGAREVRLYNDTVFALPTPSPVQVEETVARHRLSGMRYGVVTTRRSRLPSSDARKLELQAAVMRALLARREIDRVLVVAQTVGPDLDERPSARTFVEMMGESAHLLDGDFSHGDLMALYAAADLVVTQHLHSLIFATMVGTPALALSVDGNKVEGLVSGLGLPDWTVVDATIDDAAAVIDRAGRVRSARSEVGENMRRASHTALESVNAFIQDLAALDRV